MTVQIVQIANRADQGQTRPFRCRGDDGHWYYVKGLAAGRRSLICEFVAGRLAVAFGLPIAHFELVEVPPALIIPQLDPELRDLGAGIAFGSQAIPYAQEFSNSHRESTLDSFRRDVLMFDLWIRNGDRSLTEFGGNPNLLWDVQMNTPVVIDHNVIFESDFDTRSFEETHVFREELPVILGDWASRQAYQGRLSDLLPVFEQACQDVPTEWWLHAEGVPADFDPNDVRAMLSRVSEANFWDL